MSTVTPQHINLFSKRSFRRMFESLGVRSEIHQRGIRSREEVNCFETGPTIDLALAFLKIVPVDTMLGFGNNLRVAMLID